jgi:hypothetical protein
MNNAKLRMYLSLLIEISRNKPVFRNASRGVATTKLRPYCPIALISLRQITSMLLDLFQESELGICIILYSSDTNLVLSISIPMLKKVILCKETWLI